LTGLSRSTARIIDLDAHLSQSIADILTTPIGTRVMRRDYGSDLPFLIDAPMNGETMIDLFAATADAIDRWEPRFILRRVQVEEANAGGQLNLTLTGDVDGVAAVQDVTL
jgi:uncharacterized protein